MNDLFIENLCYEHNCKRQISLNEADLNKSSLFRMLSQDLKEFYLLTNGLESENLTILPFEDINNIKATWDNIEKANQPTETKYSLRPELFKDFVIFAQLEGLNAVIINKKDHSIWYEDDTGYHQTDLNFTEFITGVLSKK